VASVQGLKNKNTRLVVHVKGVQHERRLQVSSREDIHGNSVCQEASVQGRIHAKRLACKASVQRRLCLVSKVLSVQQERRGQVVSLRRVRDEDNIEGLVYEVSRMLNKHQIAIVHLLTVCDIA
jgi:hypothetical protein